MSSSPVSGRRRRREDMEQTASAGGGVQLGNRVEVIVEVMETYGRRAEVGFLPPWLTSARPPDELFALRPPEEYHKRARIPASSKAIQSLKEVSGSDGRLQAAECAVCLSDFCAAADDDSRLVREMQCSHVFHQHCIFRWLRVNHVCPLCRHALPTELDEDELHGPWPSQ